MPVGKDLVERISLEDTADVEVREVSHRNKGRGVGPCAMLDGQRPEFSLGVLEELVQMQRLSTLCGKGEIFEVSKLGEDELSSSISGSNSEL